MNRKDREISLATKTALAILVIAAAAALRVAPHPWNFTPVGAMALFSGATLRNRLMKFALPLAGLFAGDVFIGFHRLMPAVYASFLVGVAIGTWIEKQRPIGRIAGATLFGAIQFFLVTNFAAWVAFNTYQKSLAGLIACYVAGIPFFWNTLAGDAIYVTLLFGGYSLAESFLAATLRTTEQR